MLKSRALIYLLVVFALMITLTTAALVATAATSVKVASAEIYGTNNLVVSISIPSPIGQCYTVRKNVSWFNLYRNKSWDLIDKVNTENVFISIVEVTPDGLFGMSYGDSGAELDENGVFAYVDMRDFEPSDLSNCIK